MHHKIVALDAWHVPIPPDLLRLPEPHSYEISLCKTKSTSTKEIHDRVKDATIIAVTLTPLDASTLSAAITPNLRLVVVIASGTDGIAKEQCKERGIRVLNVPNANTETVAEHVLASYFACRRRLMTMHHSLLNTDEWKRTGTSSKMMHTRSNTLPLSCRQEVVGILGYGAIGQRVAQMCRGLGMTVLIASRKNATPNTDNQTPNSIEASDTRTPFAEVLRRSSVIVLCLPRNLETINMLSNDEFQMMSRNAIVINITRGGIIDEHALLKALEDGKIDGCAMDVFLVEPSGAGDYWTEGDSPILKVSQAEADKMNLLVTPHVAWYSAGTIDNYLRTFKQNVENWCSGELSNVIV